MEPIEEVKAEEAEDVAPKVSARASALADQILRVSWDIGGCVAEREILDVRLGYLELYGSAPDASDDDKDALAKEKKVIEANEKRLVERKRYLAYCQEALERERKEDEAAA